MAQIVPKLNLNKTPAIVENNSLIFAKNVRLDVDNTIHRDYGIFPLSLENINNNDSLYANHDNVINRIISDIYKAYESGADVEDYYKVAFINISMLNAKIVGIVASSNEFFVFIHSSDSGTGSVMNYDTIVRYDEKEDRFYPCNCNWHYGGGIINGCVINNLRGEKILNVGETNTDNLVSLKCINLSKSSIDDDETLYTQTPNIPLTNLNFISYFSYSIPNGVYQFFIRYKIRDNFYTDWFPASKELFAGNNTNVNTSFGTVSYLNTHKDSDNSFSFSVNHLIKNYIKNYKSFQIGFICSHDDSIVARAWKHFDMNTDTINFDYNSKDAYEIEVIDLLKSSYQIYNVGNITSFKNKLYIANYKESDFNEPNLQDCANDIAITINKYKSRPSYGGYDAIISSIEDDHVITGLVIDDKKVLFGEKTGILYRLLINRTSGHSISIIDMIADSIGDNKINIDSLISKRYGFSCSAYFGKLYTAQLSFETQLNNPNATNFKYDKAIKQIIVNKDTNNTISFGANATADEIIQNACYYTRYLNDQYKFINNKREESNHIEIIIIRNCSYTLNNTTVNDTYEQKIQLFFYAYKDEYEELNVNKLLSYTTLIPFQKYKFYVHYIKENGEITNGYYCGGNNAGILEANNSNEANVVIAPSFDNIVIPKGYIACFFSIVHCENNVATVYNIDNSNTTTEASCMDINVGLYSGINKLTIRQEIGEALIESIEGKYYYSSDSSDSAYFGADGIISIPKSDKLKENSLAYVINNYSISEAEDVQLIKCTQYITSDSLNDKKYEDYKNMNLLGYICKIYPLDRNRTKKYYTDGASVYIKQNVDNDEIGNIKFSLLELKDHLLDTSNPNERVTSLGLTHTNPVYIYSNYNLNYLTLSEEPKSIYKTYYQNKSEDTTNVISRNIVLRVFSSLSISSVYELTSMYHNYTRKIYSIFNDTSVIKFDNTVRSSKLEGDEDYTNIFKFDANDYYNIPTNRGIITNLISIGDSILVHTQDSMFKFSGSNTLQSSDGEIQPAETQVFDTGVTEVFGSDFGFAGLQNKTDSIVTENGYIFFDRDSRIIYMYSGNGQIVKISDSIEKLFRFEEISNIYFANDYYNNRFFVCIIFKDNDTTYPVTLSFNVSQDIKAFVSLHDFYYYKAFNTKTRCYFLTNDYKDICTINKKHLAAYTKLELKADYLYPQIKETYDISITNNSGESSIYEKLTINRYDTIVDIINNTQYENIKTLNSISWCGAKVISEFTRINRGGVASLRMAEDNITDMFCKDIRIYTDTCITPLIFNGKANDYSITSPNSYKYPRYNQGIWSLNYFRNILNSKGHTTEATYSSDNNSLVEGKYIVVRFIFNNAFKLETLSLNYSVKI